MRLFAMLSGYGATVPNVQYVATFPFSEQTANTDPNEVSFAWLATLPATTCGLVVTAGVSTFIICGTFSYRYVLLVKAKLAEEVGLLREGKNKKRFMIEMIMANLAGISGGMIAGVPYESYVQWTARFLGYVAVFSLSFLGMCETLTKSEDEDYIFLSEVLDHLQRIHPQYKSAVNAFLQNNELTPAVAAEFSEKIFTLAITIESQRRALTLESQTAVPGFFIEYSVEHLRRQSRIKKVDNTLSALVIGTGGIIYAQTGFDGMNIILNGLLSNIPWAGKLAFSITLGLPLVLFDYFTCRVLQGTLAELFPDIRNDKYAIPKLTALLGLNAANACWYYALAVTLVKNDSIYDFFIGTPAGKLIFPIAAYLTCYFMGVNGLAPMMFLRINKTNPQLDDVIKSFKFDAIPAATLRGLKQHQFWRKEPALPQQLQLSDLSSPSSKINAVIN
jgi:hypothetical protein